METFPIVRRNDEKTFGEFRTKHTIKQIYAALAESSKCGSAFVSPLRPTPAAPEVRHRCDRTKLALTTQRDCAGDC